MFNREEHLRFILRAYLTGMLSVNAHSEFSRGMQSAAKALEEQLDKLEKENGLTSSRKAS